MSVPVYSLTGNNSPETEFALVFRHNFRNAILNEGGITHLTEADIRSLGIALFRSFRALQAYTK